MTLRERPRRRRFVFHRRRLREFGRRNVALRCGARAVRVSSRSLERVVVECFLSPDCTDVPGRRTRLQRALRGLYAGEAGPLCEPEGSHSARQVRKPPLCYKPVYRNVYLALEKTRESRLVT